jgi:hypothetical protein
MPLTPWGIKPATCQLAVQSLNQLRYPMSPKFTYKKLQKLIKRFAISKMASFL